MSNKEKQGQNKTPNSIARRELITKYGAYTAPVVVSLLCPAKAYSDFGPGGTVYSTASTCQADTAANSGGSPFHGNTGGRHCMVGGAAGGGSTHTVIDPLS